MAMKDTQRNGTLNAMQRVWARRILKEHALERGNCDCMECRDAKASLKDY